MNSNRDHTYISIDALATHPELLVKKKSLTKLALNAEECCDLIECKCMPQYDRTISDWDTLQKSEGINFPVGFKSPMDFFETTTSEYLSECFHHLPEMHLMSFGSGQLLRELILIAKLIHAMKAKYASIPKIILHAVDEDYEDADLPCIKQFKNIIASWKEDILFYTYSSLDKYHNSRLIRSSMYPEIILSIDLPIPYNIDFPIETKNKLSYDFEDTQQGMLESIKNSLVDGSVAITLTHEIVKGVFFIVEKKENTNWQHEFIYTISSKTPIAVNSSSTIQNILDDYQKGFNNKNRAIPNQGFAHTPFSLFKPELEHERVNANSSYQTTYCSQL